MREIILYEAFDGEVFVHKQECEEFEARFQGFSNYIRFYDTDMREITVNPIEDEDSVMNAYNNSEYMLIIPEEGYKDVVHFFVDIYYGMCIKSARTDGYEAGFYKYSNEEGAYIMT